MVADFPVGWLIWAAVLATILGFANPYKGLEGRKITERDPETNVVRIVDGWAYFWLAVTLVLVIGVMVILIPWLTFTALLNQVGNKYLGLAAAVIVVLNYVLMFRAFVPKKQEEVVVSTADGQQVSGKVVTQSDGVIRDRQKVPAPKRYFFRATFWYLVVYLWYLWLVISRIVTDQNLGILPS